MNNATQKIYVLETRSGFSSHKSQGVFNSVGEAARFAIKKACSSGWEIGEERYKNESNITYFKFKVHINGRSKWFHYFIVEFEINNPVENEIKT